MNGGANMKKAIALLTFLLPDAVSAYRLRQNRDRIGSQSR